MKKLLFVAFGVFLLFAAQRECAADGKFVPPWNATAPDMPQQRAIIVYRNGVERLIIESALQGETGEYAWIIPVPSEPIEIRKASYPLFKTMFHDFRLYVYQAVGAAAFYLIILGLLALLTLFWSVTMVTSRPWIFTACVSVLMIFSICCLVIRIGVPQAPAVGILAVVLALFSVLFLLRRRKPALVATIAYIPAALIVVSCLWLFQTVGVDDEPSSEITLVNTQAIGDYDVTTLKADNADALDAWLVSGGFQSLGQDGRHIADGYIAEKWCFVAGKLRKNDKRLSAPHPIEISFKTDEAIYPMRLTSLTGRPLYIDLIIIAESAYEYPLLETEFTNEFIKDRFTQRQAFYSTRDWDTPFTWMPGLPIRLFSGPVGRGTYHSESHTLLWDCCVVSKLSGALSPAAMKEDIRPVRSAPGKILLLVSDEAAKIAGIFFGLVFLIVFIIVTTIVVYFRYLFRGRAYVGLVWLEILLLVLATFCGMMVWQSQPIGNGTEGFDRGTYYNPGGAKEAFLAACSVPGGPAGKLLEMYDVKAKRWPEMNDEMRVLLRKLADAIEPEIRKSGGRNPLTGDPITFEESPGNLIIDLDPYPMRATLSLIMFRGDHYGGHLQAYPKPEWK
ncbi:MAG: DUF2330 domain-containing protein [Candidatus Brocadiia bacterium]